MSSPGFPSGSSFAPGASEQSMQTALPGGIGESGGGGGGGGGNIGSMSSDTMKGGVSAGMGLVQMAVGISQLRKAKELQQQRKTLISLLSIKSPQYQKKQKGPEALPENNENLVYSVLL